MTPETPGRTGRILVLLTTAALVLSAVLVGFGSVNPASAQDGTTSVRFFHGVADAPPVDVYVDGELLASNVSFGEITDTYFVEAGSRSVRITEAGSEDAVLFEGEVELEPVESYTIAVSAGETQEAGNETEVGITTETATATSTAIATETATETAGPATATAIGTETETATGTATPTATGTPAVAGLSAQEGAQADGNQTANQTVEPVVLLDNATSPGEGQAALRLVHLSANTSAVTVVNSETGETLVENLTYQNSTGYMTLPEGTYTLEVRQAAADDGAEGAGTPTATETATETATPPATGTAVRTQTAVGTPMGTETPTETATPTGTATPESTEAGQDEALGTFEVTLESGNAVTGFVVDTQEDDPTAQGEIGLITVLDPVSAQTGTATETDTANKTETAGPVATPEGTPIGMGTPTETATP